MRGNIDSVVVQLVICFKYNLEKLDPRNAKTPEFFNSF